MTCKLDGTINPSPENKSLRDQETFRDEYRWRFVRQSRRWRAPCRRAPIPTADGQGISIISILSSPWWLVYTFIKGICTDVDGCAYGDDAPTALPTSGSTRCGSIGPFFSPLLVFLIIIVTFFVICSYFFPTHHHHHTIFHQKSFVFAPIYPIIYKILLDFKRKSRDGSSLSPQLFTYKCDTDADGWSPTLRSRFTPRENIVHLLLCVYTVNERGKSRKRNEKTRGTNQINRQQKD